jgi:RHS repeat-associated protein
MIGSQPLERIVNNTYDAMGQLESKGVGGTATASQSLQTVDYNYNVRGWLTNINDQNNLGNDLFGFDINYNAPALGSGSEALYNGNISETLWKTANDGITRGYQYGYDALNRIKYATYRGGTQHQASGMLENYSVNNVNYDKNGNITTLNRKGLFENASNSTMSMDYVDKLTYQYSPKSNQLINVRDIADVAANNTFNGGFKDKYSGINYIYGDANGNMTKDNNKGITAINYNHLNLPSSVQFDHGGEIHYTYDATGIKLKKEVFQTQPSTSNPVADLTSIYAGNYIYEKDNSGEKLSFFSHPEGYVEKNGAGYDYVYQYKDHLGNVRLSYSDVNQNNSDPVSIQIKEENNYYPFGLEHKGYYNVIQNSNSAASKFKYNGKEFNDELGLDWYDYGARNYDASLGRWMNIDPLAEKYESFSPYYYAANNPIRYVDYDGEDFGVTVNHENNTITIDANFYFDSQADQTANQGALDLWSSLGGMYKTKDGVEYAISFNINSTVDSDALALAEGDDIGNYITESSDAEFENYYVGIRGQAEYNEKDAQGIGGTTASNEYINNRSSKANDKSRAHEIGHALGFGENEGGAMNYAASFNSMSDPSTGNLKSILKKDYDKHKDNRSSLNGPSRSSSALPRGGSRILTIVGQYSGQGNFLDKKKLKLRD